MHRCMPFVSRHVACMLKLDDGLFYPVAFHHATALATPPCRPSLPVSTIPGSLLMMFFVLIFSVVFSVYLFLGFGFWSPCILLFYIVETLVSGVSHLLLSDLFLRFAMLPIPHGDCFHLTKVWMGLQLSSSIM